MRSIVVETNSIPIRVECDNVVLNTEVVTYGIRVYDDLDWEKVKRLIETVPHNHSTTQVFNESGDMTQEAINAAVQTALGTKASITYVDQSIAAIKPDHTIDTTSLPGKVVVKKGDDKWAVDAEKIEAPAAPSISGNTSFYNSQDITISAAEGTTLRYNMTTDGTEPADPTTTTGTAVDSNTATLTIGSAAAQTTTIKIKAIAIKNGAPSDSVTSQTFTCTRRAAKPTVGSASGNANSASRTVILSGTSGTTINYTISDGTNSTTGSVAASDTEANRTLTLSTKGTWSVTAYASQSGWADSANDSKTGIVVKKIATPSVSGNNNEYWASRTLTIGCNTTGVTLYYRYSESDAWTQYDSSNKPVINATKTVYLKAEKTDWTTTTNSATITVGSAHTHYGVSSQSDAANITLASLANEVKANSPAGTYTFANNSGAAAYMWVFVPASQSAIAHMYNAADFDQMSTFNKSTSNVTKDGVAYRWYRSKEALPNGESTTLRMTT